MANFNEPVDFDDDGIAALKAELEALKAKIAAGRAVAEPCSACDMPFPSHSWNCPLDQPA